MSKKPKKEPKQINIDPENAGGHTIGEIRAGAAFTEKEKQLLNDTLNSVLSFIQKAEFQELLKNAEERERILLPYIEKVLADPKNKRKYKGITAADVLDNLTVLGRAADPGKVTAEIIKRAGQKKRAEDARAAQQKKKAQIIQEKDFSQISYNRGENWKATKTKLTQNFFSINAPITTRDKLPGQLCIDTMFLEKPEIHIATAFSYNDAILKENGITKKEFSAFDYFVTTTFDNLKEEGNDIITLTKLWHELGHPKAPNQRQLQELLKILIKGMSTMMTVDNRAVLEYYQKDTSDYQIIVSPVMPVRFRYDYCKTNGNISNVQIEILGFSPFSKVATPLNQFETWKKETLRLYKGSRSGRYWRTMRYLMHQIAWIRNDKARCNKITIEHLCAAVGDKTRADKQRTLKLTYELLDTVFIPLDYISSYKTDNNDGGILLRFNKERKPKINADNGNNKK